MFNGTVTLDRRPNTHSRIVSQMTETVEVCLYQKDAALPATQQVQLECGPMPNVMATLLNIGGTLCSTPQSLADAHYSTAMQYRC